MGRRLLGIKVKHAKNSLLFKNRLDLAKRNRIKSGIDKTFISDVRLTDALARDEDFEILMKKIERKPRKENIL